MNINPMFFANRNNSNSQMNQPESPETREVVIKINPLDAWMFGFYAAFGMFVFGIIIGLIMFVFGISISTILIRGITNSVNNMQEKQGGKNIIPDELMQDF